MNKENVLDILQAEIFRNKLKNMESNLGNYSFMYRETKTNAEKINISMGNTFADAMRFVAAALKASVGINFSLPEYRYLTLKVHKGERLTDIEHQFKLDIEHNLAVVSSLNNFLNKIFE